MSTASARSNPQHSNPPPHLLLDPLIGPLLMAKPDEAEYLLSRHPSYALASLGAGSPYTQSNNKSNKRRRHSKKQQHGRNPHRRRTNSQLAQLKPLAPLHSQSAPSLSKPTTKKLSRLKSLHGGGNGKVTLTHSELDSNQTFGGGGAEFRVVSCILKREHALQELQRKVSSSNTRPYFATDIIYLLFDLRALAVECIESIAEWRKPHSKTFEFLWEGENYMTKMFKDASFLKVCRPLGLCLSLPGLANNPLLDFEESCIHKAISEYGLNTAWANALRRDPTLTIDYDPVELEREKTEKVCPFGIATEAELFLCCKISFRCVVVY